MRPIKQMERAVQLSNNNIKGGPFGAVIIDNNGNVIAEGSNEVTSTNDPTAHAEVVAIRRACEAKKTFDLSDCIIYSSCEPCPMCLSAIYWARLKKIYFANTREDAKDIGFDDAFIYEELVKHPEERKLKAVHKPCNVAKDVFMKWFHSDSKTPY